MPAMNTAFYQKVLSILTPAQKADLGEWTILQQGGITAAPLATKRANRSTTAKIATRATAKKTAPRSRTAKPTQQTLIDFYATNPGGWSPSDLAAKTGIKPNILGRVLNAKNSPFRKNGDLWLMNRGATVSRKLTQGLTRPRRAVSQAAPLAATG